MFYGISKHCGLFNAKSSFAHSKLVSRIINDFKVLFDQKMEL